jgi:lipopolysaccharide transport system permease protein
LSAPDLVARGGQPAARLAADEAWVIEPRGAGLVARLREVWRSRHLVHYFALRALHQTYKFTYLGWPWLLIRPLLPALIGTLVFHEVAGIDSGETPYLLFFAVGNAPWMLFEDGLTRATRGLQMNRALLRKLYFPRIILPAATMAPGVVDFLVHLLLISGLSLFFFLASGVWPVVLGPNLVLLPGSILLTLLFALGLGFFTSVIGAEKRDVRYALPYLFRFWFFLTPIVYPLSAVPADWRWLAALNPMTTVVELFKRSLLPAASPLAWTSIASTCLIVGLTFLAGLWFFARTEAASVDQL